MTGYIIGLVIGIIIFLLQNFKPTSFGFRVMFLILTAVFLWGMSYVDAGYWHILIIPVGVSVLCIVSAFCFPYASTSVIDEYMAVNGRNYFAEMQEGDKIGRIKAPGFKQTYDRIMVGLLSGITKTKSDLVRLGDLLYSENFYPLSDHTKNDVLDHIHSVVEHVSLFSADKQYIQQRADDNIELLFNVFVSVMSIHEEATRLLNEVKE